MADLTKKEKRELAKEEKRKERQKEEMMAKFKKFLGIAIILGIVGYFGYRTYVYFSTPAPQVAEQPIEIAESDWIKGAEEAEATLIEYGDFQCPACASYYPLVKNLLEDYPEELRVVYRHFPLPSHANAYDAALASEAAGRQDMFWEMHDMLFERQQDWSSLSNPRDTFADYAEELGLDRGQFLTDFESDEVADKVDADLLSGNQLQVSATPTFYLNGRKLDSIRSYEQFSQEVEEAINQNDSGSN